MYPTIRALTRYDRLGASSRVRVLQYLPALRSRGFKIEEHPLFSSDDLRLLYTEARRSKSRMLGALAARAATLRKSAPSDIVWLQQEIFPFLPYTLESALVGDRKLVIDFDDAHHLYYKDRVAARPFFGRKIERLMRRADTVVVGSPGMGAVARAAGARDVRLVYSAVDVAAFPHVAPPARFTVGWIGTPMTAAQSLPMIREPLGRFLRETGSDAVFVGIDEGQFPDIPGKRLAWSEAVEREALPRLSVGLCPLEDTPWTRGKSGYKIIQYMAAGKAALASPVGIAADLVEEGASGFHCATADDWYRRLHQYHRDPSLVISHGKAGRARAAARFDSFIAAEQLAGIFEALGRA